MRIIHVVPLASTDGSYGGPFTVASNIVAELKRRGHEAELVAGWLGNAEEPPKMIRDVPVRLFPARRRAFQRGFGALDSKPLAAWLAGECESTDVIHIHSGREFLGHRITGLAKKKNVPIIFQSHGMISCESRLIVRLADALYVRRSLSKAAIHLALTSDEVNDISQVAKRDRHQPPNIEILRNGVTYPDKSKSDYRGPINVVYCARLHARKRPTAFVEAAYLLRDLELSFSIIGPDEGELSSTLSRIKQYGLSGQVNYEGSLPYDQVLGRLCRASIYVLPSVDEPFPMSLLEAMSLGLPCVITDSTGISDELANHRAALVVERSPTAIAAAIRQLAESASLRRCIGDAARAAIRSRYSITSVVDALEEKYLRVVNR